MPSASPRGLVPLEMITGLLALGGGLLLAIDPDGSLLRADSAVLEGTPFRSWRMPGLLLFTLVGVGFVTAAIAQSRGARFARALSVAAGVGLVAFELAELAWLGVQPLELIFVGVGVAVIVLALRSDSP